MRFLNGLVCVIVSGLFGESLGYQHSQQQWFDL